MLFTIGKGTDIVIQQETEIEEAPPVQAEEAPPVQVEEAPPVRAEEAPPAQVEEAPPSVPQNISSDTKPAAMSVDEWMKNNRMGLPKPFALGYTAKDNFPDLSHHNNVMASHLTPEVSLSWKADILSR